MGRFTVFVGLCLAGLCCSPAFSDEYWDGRIYDPPSTGIKGVRAYITTALVPNLHEGAFSTAWVMLAKDVGHRYAQCGYRCDSTDPDHLYRWAQWTDDSGNPHDEWGYPKLTPASGDHRYTVWWDAEWQCWSFQYDDHEFDYSTEATSWFGGRIEFSGGVRENTTVQMVGDGDHPVKFSGMQMYLGTCPNPNWMTKWPDIEWNDAPDQWWQAVNPGSGFFKIWDDTP